MCGQMTRVFSKVSRNRKKRRKPKINFREPKKENKKSINAA
jgi:hypothetical protein